MPAKLELPRHPVILLALISAAGLALACGKSEPIGAEPIPSSGGAGGTGDAKADVLPSTACPTGLAGAALARIRAPDGSYYCMDQREVTNSEYAAFLSAKNGDTSKQPPECSWNESFTPKLKAPDDDSELKSYECPEAAWNIEDSPNYPVRCIDFCDAFAYCAWAGKRLCGEVGVNGDTVNMKSDESAEKLAASTQSEWYNACSQGGQTKYPYGDQYISGRCSDTRRGDVTDISQNECTATSSDYQGVFDLSGSVEEWANFCTSDGCAHYGGSFVSTNEMNLSCERYGLLAAITTSVATGFRCCANAIPNP